MSAFIELPCIVVPCMWLLVAAGFVFWIWMLIECVTKEPSEGNTQLIWVLIVFFGNLLGAILYFFIRRPERIRIAGE